MATQFSINSRRISDLANLPAGVSLESTFLLADLGPGGQQGQNRYQTYKVTASDIGSRIENNFEQYIQSSTSLNAVVTSKVNSISADIKTEVADAIMEDPDFKQELTTEVAGSFSAAGIANELTGIEGFNEDVAAGVSSSIATDLAANANFQSTLAANVASLTSFTYDVVTNATFQQKVAEKLAQDYSTSIAEVFVDDENFINSIASVIENKEGFNTHVASALSSVLVQSQTFLLAVKNAIDSLPDDPEPEPEPETGT